MKIRFTEERTVFVSDFEFFKENHSGAIVLAVGDKECIGRCEGCSIPILIGDKYQQWDECITCKKCSEAKELLTA